MNLAKIYNKQFVLARSTIRALVASKIWLFFLAIAPPLLLQTAVAQLTTATVVGTVTDTSGAAVPGATVIALNTDTNSSHTAQTDERGEYRIEFLPVGNYSVAITAPAFKKYIQSGLTLNVGQVVTVDAQIVIGQTSETVTVTAAAPLINTTNAEIGQTIDNRNIEQLPLINRNVYTLLNLVPGVQSNANTILMGFPEQDTLINGGTFASSGSVSYYLDGGPNMTGVRNTGNILPNPDALEEFRVETNNYGAEYGKFGGGVINAITKSGTNNFHGSVFEFLRNTALNARPWGSSPLLAKAPLHRNQFGATLGGPIVHDKTFFFGSYAGTRQNSSSFLTSAIVPTSLQRSGDLSEFLPTSSGAITSCMQTLSAADLAAGHYIVCNPTTSLPYANNKILQNQLDPVAQNIINKYIPLPNVPSAGTGTSGIENGWQGFVPSPYQTDEFLIKIDQQLRANQLVTVSYFNTSGSNTVPNVNENLPWSAQEFLWRQQNANIGDTWTLNSSTVNQIWINYVRNLGTRLNQPSTSLSDLGSLFNIQGTPSLPQITVNGYFTLANSIGGPPNGTNYYGVRDLISLTRGRHTIHFGAEQSLEKDMELSNLDNYGVYSFTGALTKNSLADFLVGIPATLEQDTPTAAYTSTWNTGFYFQDDFRISPRLTVNLGLRYDIQTPPVDSLDRASTFVPGQQSTVYADAPVGLVFPGDRGVSRSIIPFRLNRLSPRVGFAFDPNGNGKTSFRGGIGVFWSSISANQWNTASNYEPFSLRYKLPNVATTQGATLYNPYRGLAGGDPFPYQGTFVAAGTIDVLPQNFNYPYTYQANASMQQQLTNSLSFQIAYVGSYGHNLPFATDTNYPVTTPTATAANQQSRRPNQSFGPMYIVYSNQTASYNGLQVSATQRMTKNVSFTTYYVWGKTFQSVELQTNSDMGDAQDYTNLRAERGRADDDVRHQFTASIIWQPYFSRSENLFLRGLLSGWEISPIARLTSGTPFTVLNGLNASLNGYSYDRAELIGNPHLSRPTLQQFFNTAAFAQNQQITGDPVDGNSPRNFLSGPSFKDVDLLVGKTVNLHESFKMQLRAEATNAFNIISYSNPGATVNTTNFGHITSAGSTLTSPGGTRLIQLGVRFTF